MIDTSNILQITREQSRHIMSMIDSLGEHLLSFSSEYSAFLSPL